MKKSFKLITSLLLVFLLAACAPVNPQINDDGAIIIETEAYTSKEDVALYLNTYDKLPKNFITKNEAKDLGWKSSEGNLWDVSDKMSIGGDRFGNREGLLPDQSGRQYFEADINYQGGYRGAERIVYSDDGLIFYTKDHYDSFTRLYGKE